MTLNEIADALVEVGRYVRSHPKYVIREVERIEDAIREVAGSELPQHWAQRLEINLVVGRKSLGVFNDRRECVTLLRPDVLKGYLDGAAYEIRRLAAENRSCTNS